MAENVSNWRNEVALEVRGCPDALIDRTVLDICRDVCRRTRIWRRRLAPIDVIAVNATDIAMVDGDGSQATITSTTTDFTDVDGDSTDLTFVAGQSMVIKDTDDNDKVVILATVAANTLTLDAREILIDESAGNDVTLSACSYTLDETNGNISEVLEADHDDIQMLPVSRDEMDKIEPGWEDRIISDPTRFIVELDKYIRLVYSPTESLKAGLNVKVALMPLTTATTVEDNLYLDHKELITNGVLWKLMKMKGQPWADIKMAEYNRALYNNGLGTAFNIGRRGYTQAPMNMRG